MGESLREAILKRASEEAEKINASARAEAEKIVEKAVKMREEMISRERERIASEIDVEGRVAEAKTMSRQIIAAAKNEVLNTLVDRVRELLMNIDAGKRMRSLENLAVEALDELVSNIGSQSTKVAVYVSRRDLDLFEKILPSLKRRYRGLEVEVREATISGGIIVEDTARGIVIDNSYDARLRKIFALRLNEIQRLFT